MKSKRQAAADVFMAQNVAQFDEELEELADDEYMRDVELVEERQLAQAQLEAEQEKVEQSISLKKQEAELNLLMQEQKEQLANQALQAKLARQQQEAAQQLEQEEATNRVKMALAEKEVELARLQQEIRNLRNERDLASRLIEQLPEIASHMPQIHELKVLQTGNDDGAFNSLSAFLTKVLALAESVGIPLVKDGETSG